MTTTQAPPAPKPPEKKEAGEKPILETLQNAKEETKHAMLMIQTGNTVTKEQVIAALIKKFPDTTTPERAARIYEQASRQLVIEKDERNAEHFIERSLKEHTHPDVYTLMKLFPRRFDTIDEAKEFQERMLKKYQNNHTLPKAETIPSTPVVPATPPTTSKAQIPAKVNGSKTPPPPTVLSKSETPIPQNMNGSKTQTPQNITANTMTRVIKPKGKVIADIEEPVRSPLWRNFNLYADDPRTEEILLETVVTQTFSPRQQVDDDYIRSLGESLKKDGQERAILVTPREGKLLSVSGDCRVEAARKVGLTKLRGLVVHLTDEQAIALGLAANLEHDLPHRPLTPIEEAKVIKKLTSDPYNWTQEKAAEFFGKKDQSWVSYRLGLLDTSKDIQKKVEDGSLSITHARALSGLPQQTQDKVAEKVVKEGLSVRATENLAREVKSLAEPMKVTPEEIDVMLAKKREETIAQNKIEIGKSIPITKAMEDGGLVPLHMDDKGIYFFRNKCPACGNEHSIGINMEDKIAILTRPKDLVKAAQ
jgi:ParB/RepB/Spo0J family partition protein